MDKSVLRFKRIVEGTNSIKECIKTLNLDIYSSFLCFLRIIEDSILEYKEGYDYSYLIKVSEYLEKTYMKLSIKTRENYRSSILLLRKIYKKQQGILIKKDKVYFGKVYNTLNNLLENNKEKVNLEPIDDLNMYDLLYEVIFNIQKLEYLDKVIETIKGVLNSEKDSENIFFKVVNEYIKQVSLNNYDLIDYYERVINKFLLEETFDLTDQMKNNIIKTLYDFIKNKRNLNSKLLKRIKVIIDSINYKSNLFTIFDIPTTDADIFEDDVDLFKKKRQTNERVRINEYTITIDDIDSSVLDDAISYKKLKNGNSIFRVHIADPLAILPYNSDTILEARRRVETIHHKDSAINMIPLLLSGNKLSLVKGEDRYAKTFCYELDSDFNIVDFYVLNTIIKVSDRLTYDTLNKLYKKGGRTKEEDELLAYYDNILNLLKRVLSQVKNYHELKEKMGNRHSDKTSSFADKLVSYSMILTGHMTSKYFFTNSLPYVYRCNSLDQGWLDLLDKTIGKCSSPEEQKMLKIVKSHLPKSHYSIDNLGHTGLGLESYSHITSPLRRFPDILNMHALDTCYFETPDDMDIYELEEEIKLVSSHSNLFNNTLDDYMKSKCKKK